MLLRALVRRFSVQNLVLSIRPHPVVLDMPDVKAIVVKDVTQVLAVFSHEFLGVARTPFLEGGS